MRMRRQTLCTAAALGFALATASGTAQDVAPLDDAGPAETPAPMYQVEFILFAHADADPNEEIFADELSETVELPIILDSAPIPLGGAALAPEPPAAYGDGPFEYFDPFGHFAENGGIAPFMFRLLSADEMQLDNAYARIERLGAYRALAHGGWVQEGLDEASARPMNLGTLGIVNPAGTLRLHLGRYLHLTVDLEYQAPGPAGAGAGQQTATSSAFGSPLTEFDVIPRYHLVEQRRARSGELHYIDHPMFGLLFLITPVREDDPGASDAEQLPAA
jgi:Peptidoglycan-binding protein, CsiV